MLTGLKRSSKIPVLLVSTDNTDYAKVRGIEAISLPFTDEELGKYIAGMMKTQPKKQNGTKILKSVKTLLLIGSSRNRNRLEQSGLKVDYCSNEEEALNRFGKKFDSFDLVLMDVPTDNEKKSLLLEKSQKGELELAFLSQEYSYNKAKSSKLLKTYESLEIKKNRQMYHILLEDKPRAKAGTILPVIKVPLSTMNRKTLYWQMSQELLNPSVNIEGLISRNVFEVIPQLRLHEWRVIQLSADKEEVEKLKSEVAELSDIINRHIKSAVSEKSIRHKEVEFLWKEFKEFIGDFRTGSKYINAVKDPNSSKKTFEKWLQDNGKTIDDLMRESLLDLAKRIKQVTPTITEEQLETFKKIITPVGKRPEYTEIFEKDDPVVANLTVNFFNYFMESLNEVRTINATLDEISQENVKEYGFSSKENFEYIREQWNEIVDPILEQYLNILPLSNPRYHHVMLEIEGKFICVTSYI
jgi:hypothetical protein